MTRRKTVVAVQFNTWYRMDKLPVFDNGSWTEGFSKYKVFS